MSTDRSKADPQEGPRTVSDMPTPLYHKVRLILRDRIDRGYYGEGGRLPSEAELGKEFDVSRITVSRAINELARQGLVERRRGAGTRIVANPRQTRPVATGLKGLLQSLNDMGNRTQVEVLEFGFVTAPAEVQTGLEVEPGDTVQRAVRVRSHNGQPFSYIVSYIRGEIGRRFGREDMVNKSMLSLLEENGVEIGSARQSFSATLADPATCGPLDVPVGTPLLVVTRTVSDASGRPVEFLRVLYRTDRYQYRMTLDREEDGEQTFWSTHERESKLQTGSDGGD